jgi:IS1 family transposase
VSDIDEDIVDEDEGEKADNECFMDSLAMGTCEDMLLNELYSKERGRRVECYGLQLDEMWSFVGKKENKQWIWLALNPVNRQIIGFYVGARDAKAAQKLYDSIPDFFKEQAGFFSDYWRAYQKILDPESHFAVGKDSGLTAYIERFNCTLRQRASRLVRKALSFSKKQENHVGAIKYFIIHYNKQCQALHL